MSAPFTTSPAPAATLVGRNTTFRVAAQAISAVINVAGMMLLGGHLSAAGYGHYVAWYALVPLLASVADLGLGVVVTRAIAREPDSIGRVLGQALTVRAVIGAVMLALLVLAAWPLLGAERTLLLACVAAAAVLDFGLDPAVWVSRAQERLGVESGLLIVSQCAWLAGIAWAAATNAPLAVFLAVAVAAFALRSAAGVFWLARQGVRPVLGLDRARLGAALREGVPVALALLLVVLYGRAGVFALQLWSTPGEVACFNVAWLLAQPLGFLASALGVALFPSVARIGQERAAFASALRPANRYQWVVSLPIAAGLALVAPALLPVLFPSQSGFAHAADALRIVALALPFVFFNLQSRYLLAACGEQRVYLGAVMLGLLIEIAGCAWSVRTHGAVGAAWTFVAAEAAVFAVCQLALHRRAGAAGLLAEAWRPMAAVAAMAVAVRALPALPLVMVVVVGVVSYAAALVVVGGWTRLESDLVRSVLATFRPAHRAPAIGAGRPS